MPALRSLVLLIVLVLALAPAAPAASLEPLTAQPLNAQAYRDADALFLRREQAGAAEQGRVLLERALATCPDDSGLLWRYGRARVVLGESAGLWSRGSEFAAAERALEAALAVDPGLVDAQYWLAVARYRRGRRKAALETLREYEQGLGRASETPGTYVSLAEAYVELGQDREAAAILDRLNRASAAGGPLPAEEADRLERLRRRLRL